MDDPNVLWVSGLDHKNLRSSDIPNGADEVGERDGDRRKFEWLDNVRIEDGIEGSDQLG